MPPTIPFNHYISSRNQQNRTNVLFHYPMLIVFKAYACFEHSNLLKVNELEPYKKEVEQAERTTPKRNTSTSYPPDPSCIHHLAAMKLPPNKVQ